MCPHLISQQSCLHCAVTGKRKSWYHLHNALGLFLNPFIYWEYPKGHYIRKNKYKNSCHKVSSLHSLHTIFGRLLDRCMRLKRLQVHYHVTYLFFLFLPSLFVVLHSEHADFDCFLDNSKWYIVQRDLRPVVDHEGRHSLKTNTEDNLLTVSSFMHGRGQYQIWI